ncbi:putative bacterioferritin comigratory protein [Burkholderiales bacterium]|nr:putative bacterioferritin comigratory protein [Burkholderiales bacterium]
MKIDASLLRRALPLLLAPVLGTAPVAAIAALAVGADAPDFTAQAALGGKAFTFSLAQALKKGPVVLYFYPKAFTKGCTIEAHNFAEASEKFAALGATLIGMSNDDIETLKEFSVKECRNKFAVAADAGAHIMKQYDAALTLLPNTADRISYVISPEGRVIYVYSSLSPDNHVENTLRAVRDWHATVKAQEGVEPQGSY